QRPWLARLLGRQSTVVVAVPTAAPVVALTVDDGPHPVLTPQILATLERHGARATFFFLGSGVERHPHLARAAVSQGHEVGNHGWLDRPAVRMPSLAFEADVARTARTIEAVTGAAPRVFRPGSGWFRPSQLRHVRAIGNQLVLGSVAVVDLTVRRVDREVAFVLRRLQPGAVVVLHEGRDDRRNVVPLLERLLPEMHRLGYRSVTVSELVAARADGQDRPWSAPLSPVGSAQHGRPRSAPLSPDGSSPMGRRAGRSPRH
ncbi:MAG: polysaccharide deacetylase family protein, partial [Ornithinibacter sp.]